MISESSDIGPPRSGETADSTIFHYVDLNSQELMAADVPRRRPRQLRIIETTRGGAPEAWQRHLDVFIAGLRPAGEPLPDRELSREKIDELMAERL
jgi:hypothetical protein